MIDLNKAKQEFLKYVNNNYDIQNIHIEMKREHSLRVMEASNNIAKKLDLCQEDIDLATLIGLLHDIARFEQYTKYKTFRDSISIDHGDLAVEILKKNNFIRNFIDTDMYDYIIFKAIKNHNKYKIEEGLNDRELLFSKIIRDADKIDIFYEAYVMFWKEIEEEIEKSEISKDVEESFKKYEPIKKKSNQNRTYIDKVLIVIAFIFDMNFKESFIIIKNEDYINKILDRFNFEKKESMQLIEEIKDIANKYIADRIR